MEPSHLADSVGTLTSSVRALREGVDELSRRTDTQDRMLAQIRDAAESSERNRQFGIVNRVLASVAVLGLVLVLVLYAFGVRLYQKVDANTRDVSVVQERTSTEILCPLYELFALSIRVTPPPAAMTPGQADLRTRAGETIARGLDKLGCARPK